jgi:hypothetical protein
MPVPLTPPMNLDRAQPNTPRRVHHSFHLRALRLPSTSNPANNRRSSAYLAPSQLVGALRGIGMSACRTPLPSLHPNSPAIPQSPRPPSPMKQPATLPVLATLPTSPEPCVGQACIACRTPLRPTACSRPISTRPQLAHLNVLPSEIRPGSPGPVPNQSPPCPISRDNSYYKRY